MITIINEKTIVTSHPKQHDVGKRSGQHLKKKEIIANLYCGIGDNLRESYNLIQLRGLFRGSLKLFCCCFTFFY